MDVMVFQEENPLASDHCVLLEHFKGSFLSSPTAERVHLLNSAWKYIQGVGNSIEVTTRYPTLIVFMRARESNDSQLVYDINKKND